jgi:hypothetical protein
VLFEEKCNPAILYPVYDAIERTRADKRPARAALLYQEGTTEFGLVKVRPCIELWGSNSQIAASCFAARRLLRTTRGKTWRQRAAPRVCSKAAPALILRRIIIQKF